MTPGRKPALAYGDLVPVACHYQECVGPSQLVQLFGAMPTGFSALRFTSHLSYSLLVSDSGPLAQLYPGGFPTRKLGNPFQVTLDYLTIFHLVKAIKNSLFPSMPVIGESITPITANPNCCAAS